jgi:ABC-type lipoprotein release transport system permease subunit
MGIWQLLSGSHLVRILLATWIPAQRASSVDPVILLRAE